MNIKIILLLFIILASLQSFSQVKISDIIGYEYNNQKNTFSPNIVGKESSAIDGRGNQTLIVIKLTRIPGAEYKYIQRKLKIIAQYENKGRVE